MRFFERLVDAAGPSGDERQLARVWREYTSGFATTHADPLGSSVAAVNAEGSAHQPCGKARFSILAPL